MSKIQRAAELQAKMPQVPARLRVSLAAKAHKGLILRTGPGKWTQAILWHTDNDTFEYGQWFHGSVYANLAPDGSKMVYHGVKYHLEHLVKEGQRPDLLYRWIAVSRPPYFTALALWEVDEYVEGGAFFADDRTLLLSSNMDKSKLRQPTKGNVPESLEVATDYEYMLWLRHEEHQGWEIVKKRVEKRDPDYWAFDLIVPLLWKKRDPQGRYTLFRKKEDSYYPDYYLVESGTERSLHVGAVKWADLDESGRLVFFRDGKLLSCSIREGEIEATEIADFNDQKITEVIAPEWARHW
jgi:hypothetical protein